MCSWNVFKKMFGSATALPACREPDARYLEYKSAQELLATPRRTLLLDNIWHRTSVSKQQFTTFYYEPLSRYAELVQQLPASENHHHAYLGGMLDHGLEIVAYALKLRQSYVLPLGSTPEVQSAQAEAWSAGVAFAALLHDVGKIAVDMKIELKSGKVWHPWHGPMRENYRLQYVKGREYRLHSAAAGLVYQQILPTALLDWLCQYPELWASMLYVLAGQFEHAGVLGDIVMRSDQASVASELGGNPEWASAAPKHTLQRQLVEGLRYLIKNELRINQAEASDGWVSQEAVWLVSKTVADRLKAHLLSQGSEGIPGNNSGIFNVLQDNGIILANPQGKAIWKAEVASSTGWTHTFTFLKVSPSLIWGNDEERPESFTGSVTVVEDPETSERPIATSAPTYEQPLQQQTLQAPTAITQPQPAPDVVGTDEIGELLNLFNPEEPAATGPSPFRAVSAGHNQDNGQETTEPVAASSPPLPVIGEDKPDSSRATLGQQFMHWLKVGIGTRKIIINDANAKVHTVSGTAFIVTPEIFRRYVQEHPQLFTSKKAGAGESWLKVQKSFEKLKLHQKKNNGLNIWTCEVFGPRKSKSLKGYLLSEPGFVFAKTVMDNPNLRLIGELQE